MKIKKMITCLFVFSLIILPVFIYADTPVTNSGSSDGTINIPNPLQSGVNDFMSLVILILTKIIMPIASIGVVVFIIYAGFTYVLAQGKPAEIQKAHSRLLWGLIGGGIILGAWGISQVVQNTVNSFIK